MKHISGLSVNRPAQANVAQDVACAANEIISALKAAEAPGKTLITDACTIPEPGTQQ